MIFHTTYHGLEKWFCSLFEKLGWMILAVHNNNYVKAQSYVSSIQMLKEALKQKITETKEPDRIKDLQNLQYNLRILERFVKQHFVLVKQQQQQKKQQLPQRILQKVDQVVQQQQQSLQKLFASPY